MPFFFKSGIPAIGFLFTLLMHSGSAFAQDASLDDIMKAHVKALGGEKAISKVMNFDRQAEVSLESGFGSMKGIARELVDLKEKRFYSDLDLGQYKKTEAIAGESGWTKGTDGDRDMNDQEITFGKMSLGVSPLLLAHETAEAAMKVNGTENLNGNECYVIALGSGIQYLVNTKSNLLEALKIEDVGTLILNDYKTVDGVQLPGTRVLTLESQGVTISYKYNSTEINGKIDDSLFGELIKASESEKPTYTAEQIIGFLDKDGDKQISEVEAATSPELDSAFPFVDTSKDGFIDLEEAHAMVKYQEKQTKTKPPKKRAGNDKDKITAKSIIASMDKNEDGKISKSEANAELALFFDDLDNNKDGNIDEAECETVAEFMNSNK